MSIISKPPEMVKREYELQEPIAVAVEKYAAFIASTPDHVVNSALKMVLWKDADFPPLAQATAGSRGEERRYRGGKGGAGVIQRILDARHLLAGILAAVTEWRSICGCRSRVQSFPPRHRYSLRARVFSFSSTPTPCFSTPRPTSRIPSSSPASTFSR